MKNVNGWMIPEFDNLLSKSAAKSPHPESRYQQEIFDAALQFVKVKPNSLPFAPVARLSELLIASSPASRYLLEVDPVCENPKPQYSELESLLILALN